MSSDRIDPVLLYAVNSSMLSICIALCALFTSCWIWHKMFPNIQGAYIYDFIHQKKYRMFLWERHKKVLDGLQANLSKIDKRINLIWHSRITILWCRRFWLFIDSPVFDDEEDGAENNLFLLALGAPKQEIFMWTVWQPLRAKRE